MNTFQRSILANLALSVICANAATEMTAQELGYRIDVYECDANLKMIPTEDRQVKNQGSVYRVCFRPNNKALEDGVGIKEIHSFAWELETKKGVVEQQAVINGNGDDVLSILNCEEDRKLCYLDSLLGSRFYVDPGSVLGYGEAYLTIGTGTVDMEKWLFQYDFKFTMKNPDGTEMNGEEAAELMARMDDQEAVVVEANMESEGTADEKIDEL
jgi:hypothetical protein